MNKHVRTVLLLALLIGSFLCGAWYNGNGRESGGGKDKQGERKVLYYVDPMNPAHTSDKPGVAPCGMALERVLEDDVASGSGNPPRYLLPGTARITPEKQQMFGIRVEEARVTSLTHALRCLGRVSADENRTYRMLAGADGWVWTVREATTGSLVKKDQLMATVYNYQFLSREQQYLFALDFAERNEKLRSRPLPPLKPGERRSLGSLASDNMATSVPTAPSGLNPTGNVYYVEDQVALAKLELYNLGVGDYQVRELGRTKRVTTELEVRSPVSGIVLARNVSPMQRFDKGAELYQIADVSRVWVLADVFEKEARYVHPGTKARVTLPDDGQVFHAEVTDVPPLFDSTSRSFKVRLEVDNPDFELRPDMFVDVELLIDFLPVINVPVDAVLDSGQWKRVFVDQGEGYFEPRTVKTGWRFGERVEIVEGLMPGEKIVASGNFLVDSESRMKLAVAGLFGIPHKDPICGMEVYGSKTEAAGLTAERDGKTAWFCSEECKKAFLDNPDIKADNPAVFNREDAANAAGSAANMAAASKDPVCGMLVHENRARDGGLTGEHRGKSFFFCSEECKKLFQMYPDRYAERAAGMAGRGQSAKVGEGRIPAAPAPALAPAPPSASPSGPAPVPPSGSGPAPVPAEMDSGDGEPDIPVPRRTHTGDDGPGLPAPEAMDTGGDGPSIPIPPKPRTHDDGLEPDLSTPRPRLPEVRNDEDSVPGVALSEHRHDGMTHPPGMAPPALDVQTYSPGSFTEDGDADVKHPHVAGPDHGGLDDASPDHDYDYDLDGGPDD